MKKVIVGLVFVLALSGCDDANKMIEKTKDSVNETVVALQEHIESIDMSKLNLEQFGDAENAAKKMASSVDEVLSVDFSNMESLKKAKEHLSNSYACLVDVSSESSAENLLNKIKSSISNEEAKSLIDSAIDKAKAGYECIK